MPVPRLARPAPVADDDLWHPGHFADELRFLWEEAWPGDEPEVVETHVSIVFLVGDRAYKLKKPVRLPYLDYRSVESRRQDCEAEVALNQALAPGVYLGLLPVVRDPAHRFHLGGEGEAVDWLVVMRRLHRTDLLDHVLLGRRPGPQELGRLVDRLVAFYRGTPSAPCPPATHRRRLGEGLRLDATELRSHLDRLDARSLDEAVATLEAAITATPGLDDRAGRRVDGHGDLRPEHVVLEPVPLVIDRVTFDRDLRLVDPLYDLALLAVECEHLGAGWVGDAVIDGYRQCTGEPTTEQVTRLYRALRAMTRARLSIAHLRDRGDDAHDLRWTTKASDYLAIAARHAGTAP